MEIMAHETLKNIFILNKPHLTIYMDKCSNLFWAANNLKIYPLQHMPWQYQQAFFFTFLHSAELSEKFKDMEIIGAIDLFIKSKFCLGEPLELDV